MMRQKRVDLTSYTDCCVQIHDGKFTVVNENDILNYIWNYIKY